MRHGRDGAEPGVDEAEADRDDDGRAHQAQDRCHGAGEAMESASQRDGHVADVGAGQELAQGEQVGELGRRQPAAVVDDHAAGKRQHAAEPEQADPEEAGEHLGGAGRGGGLQGRLAHCERVAQGCAVPNRGGTAVQWRQRETDWKRHEPRRRTFPGRAGPAAAPPQWGDKQLVPADYVALCNKPLPYNPHCPFTLQFENNSDGHVAGAPKDAYYKSGAGGFGIFVVPSLDLVIYKLGGRDNQYDPTLTGIPQPFQYDGSRDNWQPIPRTPFNEGSMGGDDGLRRVLEMVSAAVRD